MFNFQNLSDYEFEVVCKDILEIKTDKRFNTFARGKDGGIDIRGLENESVIAQVKHYIDSPVSSLIASLKKEVKKIKKIGCDEYYVFTSQSLSANKIDEIYSLFQEVMSSKENVFDRVRLENLLAEDKYLNVVKKHYKLWLASSKVLDVVFNQNVFIDTEDLMFDIERESKLFVKTTAYHDAFKILSKERLVIIQGNPGVGKTIISKMLVLFYASQKYIVRYASDSSIKDLKKAISSNHDVKEIILLDDFLGQHYLSLKENQSNEIKSLISYVLRNPNKRIILNTRITILKEAMRINHKFKSFIEEKSTNEYLINVDQMSLIDKAEVLYNHLYFKSLPLDYFNELLVDDRYMDIIQHKNYNPRIIEYVTTESRYSRLDSKDYYNYIITNLNNPQNVWEEVFEEGIDITDRILLFCLYSLTNNVVSTDILKKTFLNWIKSINVDKTKDQFGNSLKRLSESMIKLVDIDGKHYVGVINPSVNDYLMHKITNNESIIDGILDNAIYIEQIYKMEMLNEKFVGDFIVEVIKTHDFLNLSGLSHSIEYYFLDEIEKKEITDSSLKDIIHKLLIGKSVFNTPDYDYYQRETFIFKLGSHLIIRMLNNDVLFRFYKFDELIFNIDNVPKLIEHMGFVDIPSLVLLYERLYDESDEFWDDFLIELEESLSANVGEKIEDDIFSEMEDSLFDILLEIFNDVDTEIKINYREYEDDVLLQIMEEEIKTEISERLKAKNEEIGCNFINVNGKIDMYDIFSELDIASELDILCNPEPDDYYYDDYPSNKSSSNADELKNISMIFQRDYKVNQS